MADMYFPIINGSQWVYQQVGGPGLVHVWLEVGPETEHGLELYFHYRDLRRGEAWLRHMRLRDNEVYMVDRFGDEEGPILKLPMSVAQNWAYHANNLMVVRCFMVDVGNVQVPAGEFSQVLKVEYQYSSGFSEAELYAPHVGLVGYVERYDEEDEVYRLVYYRAGDGSLEVGHPPQGKGEMSPSGNGRHASNARP